jgi:hypothetical protein
VTRTTPDAVDGDLDPGEGVLDVPVRPPVHAEIAMTGMSTTISHGRPTTPV